MASNEDFWNESSSSKFDFGDDEEDSSYTQGDCFAANVQENIPLQIDSIISNKCLKIILDETDSTVEHVVAPAEETIRRMFHAENFMLNTYRSFENKLQLLDAAIDIGDGNIIITVILFLSKTLNNNKFFTQLSRRKVAVRHYANYLIEKNSLQELADLYMATGHISYMKDIYCLLSKDIPNQNVQKLKQFNRDHSRELHTSEDKTEIQEILALLDFQIKHKLNSKSVIEQLINLCRSEWSRGNGDDVNNFKKLFKIDDFQFEWVEMSVLCKMQNWEKLIATFTKSVWVIKKKRALKSVIRPELFVVGISRHNPPEYVTEQFLSCISDASKVLYLAEKLKIHKIVVNYHVEQKDKTSLLKYMERVEPSSPAWFAIQSSLNNTDIKWKN
ncbi:hypothetical protein Zmor_002666 [Zophobas morio]|uniref:Vps16 C-terminal domain-containing protein n=1 Tax=Zophobas morio TaxID=2755281 RepID=A0AA38HL80_9CUCU|nr:hypothetical protein Zmor_002666 [Zophobas morio]